MPQLTFKPQARFDTLQITTYLAERNISAATQFLDAFETTCTLLAEMPGIGKSRHFNQPELQGMRSWSIKGFENYLVFYKPVADGADIFRVIHGARDMEAIFGE